VLVIKGEEKEGRKKAIGRDKVPYISTQWKNRQTMSIKVPQAHKSTAWVGGKLKHKTLQLMKAIVDMCISASSCC
jgi:hypothetical protein